MAHLSAERLAELAVDRNDPLADDQLAHLGHCPECSAEYAGLLRIVELAHTSAHELPVRPPARVWPAVRREISALHRVSGSRAGRRRPLAVVAALVAGLAIGAGGAAVVDVAARGRTTVLSGTDLSALPRQTGRGTAQIVNEHGVLELRVRVQAPAPLHEFRSVWLISSDGRRMYSLGVLPADGSGLYPLPAPIAGALHGFTTVDVSLEPFDGDARHSGHSQLRGVLPG